MRPLTNDSKGFSLIETIAASAILSAIVLVALRGSTAAISTTALNREYEVAASLIEKQLSLLDFVGIDDFIDVGTLEGDFEGYEPAYHWYAETEYQDIDSLYKVTLTVAWVSRNRPHSLTVETMFNGESTIIEIEIESDTDTGSDSGGDTSGGSAPGSNAGPGSR